MKSQAAAPSVPAPAFEFAEDYGTWLAGRTAWAQRSRLAEVLVRALINAAACEPPAQRLPTRESHAEHLRAVALLAAWLRDYRARGCCLTRNALARNLFAARLLRAGVTMQEVEASV